MNLRKRFAAVGVALVAVLSLSGCMRVESGVWINSEGQVDKVGMTIALDKAAIQQLGAMGMDAGATSSNIPTDLESFKEFTLNESDGADRAKVEEICEWTESSTEWIMSCEGDLAALGTEAAELNAALSESLTITKEGSTITAVVQPSADATQGAEAAAGAAMMGMESNFFLNFPGKVTNVSGPGAIDPNDPNRVVINVITATEPVTVTAESGGGLPIGMIAGGLVGLLIVGGVVFFLMSRGGGKNTGGSNAGPVAASNSGWQQGQQQWGQQQAPQQPAVRYNADGTMYWDDNLGWQPVPQAQPQAPQQPFPPQAPQQPFPPQGPQQPFPPQGPQQPFPPQGPQQPFPPQG